jgi:hypothetical protein
MIFLFNLFDVIGRAAATFVGVSLYGLWGLVISRSVFFYTFYQIINAEKGEFTYETFSSSGFIAVNMSFYAFTNGFTTNLLMAQAPGRIENFYKEKVGYCMSACLLFGIIAGQFLSYLV